MNVVGRFLAYKAMNAAWRSATRKQPGLHHSGPVEAADTVSSLIRTFLFFLTAFVLILLSMASCLSGNMPMVGLGFVLFLLAVPLAFLLALFLPDRWLRSRPPHPRQEKEAARVKAHYAAYARERTGEEKGKLAEYQERNRLTVCPVSGVMCEWGDPPCFKLQGETFCIEQGPEDDRPSGQPTTIEADIDSSPPADTTLMNERPYVVYFIQEKGDDGKCKVGITYSLESRLRSLQTGNPHELEAVHTLWVPNKDAAERIEEAVLNAVRNAGADMRGEWFQSAILPWAQQVAETERERIEGRNF